MAIKKTALLLDEELVAQVKELLGTGTTTETLAEALREVIRVRGRARHFERLRQRATDLTDPEAMGGQWASEERHVGGRGADGGDPPR